MAITKIKRIRGHISHIINYAENTDKTCLDKDEIYNLHNVIKYAADDNKTEHLYYVSGINVTPQTATEEMLITKKQFGKTDGITAYHLIQSFKSGETTPDLCHKIGIHLAEKLWGDRFQIIVATHLNTNCAHNHIILNSVSFADGKRLYNNKELYKQIRETSDKLCVQYELSVIKNPEKRGYIPYNLYMANKEDKPTLFNSAREDIDRAIQTSYTYKSFILRLKQWGYEVREGKYLSIRPKGSEKSVRTYRLGDEYTMAAIKQRIIIARNTPSRVIPLDPPYQKPTIKRYKIKGSFKNTKKLTGFKALYIKYMYLLGKLPKHKPHNPRHPVLKADLWRFQEYQRQFRLLTENKIDTYKHLTAFICDIGTKIEDLTSQRNHIYNQLRHCTDTTKINDLKASRDKLTNSISTLRKNLKTANTIETRVAVMKENIRAVSNRYNKEILKKKQRGIER